MLTVVIHPSGMLSTAAVFRPYSLLLTAAADVKLCASISQLPLCFLLIFAVVEPLRLLIFFGIYSNAINMAWYVLYKNGFNIVLHFNYKLFRQSLIFHSCCAALLLIYQLRPYFSFSKLLLQRCIPTAYCSQLLWCSKIAYSSQMLWCCPTVYCLHLLCCNPNASFLQLLS